MKVSAQYLGNNYELIHIEKYCNENRAMTFRIIYTIIIFIIMENHARSSQTGNKKMYDVYFNQFSSACLSI